MDYLKNEKFQKNANFFFSGKYILYCWEKKTINVKPQGTTVRGASRYLTLASLKL